MGKEECIIQVNEEEVTEGGESSMMAMERDWLSQTKSEVEEVDKTSIKESGRRGAGSIYRIPWNLRKLNCKAYQPHVVSIGPYHHGEARLKDMEEHKHNALLRFLQRTEKSLEHYLEALAPEMQKIKDAYAHLQHEYKKPDSFKFRKMMIVDGCFILELVQWDRQKPGSYCKNDPIFSEHGFLYLQPLLRRDMLILENQIPLLVLVKLQKASEDGDEKMTTDLTSNILKFFKPATYDQNYKDKSKILEKQIKERGDFLHILDLYRKSLLLKEKQEKSPRTSPRRSGWLPSHGSRNPQTARTKSRGSKNPQTAGTKAKGVNNGNDSKKEQANGMPSATELAEGGIQFKKSETEYLNDKDLEGSCLKLPRVTLDATSKHMFLNLMAYERLHVGDGKEAMNDVTSYVFFMDRLIDTAKDVALLHRHGIVENFLGSDDDAAKLFNRLTIDICPDNGKTFELQNKVGRKYRKRGIRWLAFAKHNYCINPWVIATIAGGILIFLFTATQTTYAIVAYHRPPHDPSSPSPSP